MGSDSGTLMYERNVPKISSNK